MNELKTQIEVDKLNEFYKGNIISLDTTFIDNEGIKGFSSVALIPVIQLHSDTRNIKDLFYTAYGKSVEKAKAINSNIIFIMCNNEDLSKQLIKKENFKELDFKILFKEI